MTDEQPIEDTTPYPEGLERSRVRRTFKHKNDTVLGVTCIDPLCDAPPGPHRHVMVEVDLDDS